AAAILAPRAQAKATAPVTSKPLAAVVARGLHKLFPFREHDEAFEAQAQGALSAADLQKFMAGAPDASFHDMDYGIPKDPEALRQTFSAYIPNITKEEAVHRAARGRNNWIVWTGGNDRFWTYMTQATFGSLDFLKTISNHPNLPASRDNRWRDQGLVNEP